MLSVLISLPIVCFVLWLVWWTSKLFRWHKVTVGWWSAMGAILIGGSVGGYQLGILEFKISETFRWVGVPLPIGFFQLEGERWVDFVPPSPVQWLNLLADVLSPVGILLCLLLLAWRWRSRKKLAYGEATSQGIVA